MNGRFIHVVGFPRTHVAADCLRLLLLFLSSSIDVRARARVPRRTIRSFQSRVASVSLYRSLEIYMRHC